MTDRLLRPWFGALGFLTCFPVPPAAMGGEGGLARTVGYFPAAGALIGASLALVAWLGQPPLLGLPAPLLAVALLTAWVWLTGGLHLDGFMDMVDGLASRKPGGAALAVMQDARVGAMGAAGGALLLLWKLVLLWSLLEVGTFAVYGAVFLAPLWSRWAMAL
ncbi:MAG: adenosylcobinamide-GDP ribazoletransferase, partial [Thermaerobacterales bacterium]